MTPKVMLLVIVLGGIVGVIWYLESAKNRPTRSTFSGEDEIPAEVAAQNSAELTATSSPTQDAATSSAQLPAIAPTPQKPSSTKVPLTIAISDRIKVKANQFPRVKEISTPDGFINTAEGFKLADWVGRKVILIDFWTYSCINCQRTTPYLNAWRQKYKDQGFEIVGIHTPEFDFEKQYDNVLAAVREEGIQYPVILDNDYSTWTAYQNRFWPRRYLVDIDGFIVFDQIGEGGYDLMEKRIQLALGERSLVLGLQAAIASGVVKPDLGADTPSGAAISPETYFGSSRNELLANGKSGVSGAQTLSIPENVRASKLYLDGAWLFAAEYAQNSAPGGKIVYRYQAKNVYFVASSDTQVKVKILRDGKLLTASVAGEDVAVSGGESSVSIKKDQLYKLIKEDVPGSHILELLIEDPGLRAFTFTFG